MRFLLHFGKSIIGSIIVLAVFVLISLTVLDTSLDSLITGLYGDIYEFAEPEAQRDMNVFLRENCQVVVDSLAVIKNISGLRELCADTRQLKLMREQCVSILAYPDPLSVDIDTDMLEMCRLIDSKEWHDQCRIIQNQDKASLLDRDTLYDPCLDLLSGELTKREQFSRFFTAVTPQRERSFFPEADKEIFIILSGVILFSLIALFFLHEKDIFSFLYHIGSVTLRVGIFLLLPVVFVSVFFFFLPPDTTWVLESVMNATSGDMMGPGMLEFLPLVVHRMIPPDIYLYGIGFLSFGMTLRFFTRPLKREKVDMRKILSKEHEQTIREEFRKTGTIAGKASVAVKDGDISGSPETEESADSATRKTEKKNLTCNRTSTTKECKDHPKGLKLKQKSK